MLSAGTVEQHKPGSEPYRAHTPIILVAIHPADDDWWTRARKALPFVNILALESAYGEKRLRGL